MSHVSSCHNPYQLPKDATISPILLHDHTITVCTHVTTANICSLQELHLCPMPHYSLMIILTCHILSIPFHSSPESPKAWVLFMLPNLPVLVAKHPYVSHCSILSFFSILGIPFSSPAIPMLMIPLIEWVCSSALKFMAKSSIRLTLVSVVYWSRVFGHLLL